MRKRQAILVTIIFSLLATTNAIGWKPSTHVYLALRALDEILSGKDYFGNDKEVGEIPIYQVNYHTGEITGVVGYYPADETLIDALENHRTDFIAGVLGPDAYPDIATGQTRIHVHEPVSTDAWLKYLWQQAQNGDPEILAFVLGYLTHAAGDMYMHTFVNYYAGGPFKLPTNGLKHIVFEGYIGKRTPPLADEVFELPISQKALDFVYRYLTDTRSGTYLSQQLYKTNQINPDEPSQIASVPMLYSMLRDGLQAQIDFYDNEIAGYDQRIEEKRSAAEDCGPIVDPNCAPLYADMDIEIGKKAVYQTANFLQTEYLRAWVADIDTGLRAWPAFSHEIAKVILLSAEGLDIQKADSLANEYRNRYLLSMSGVPDGVGGTLVLIETMKQIIFPPEIRAQIDGLKAALLDTLLVHTWGLTKEETEDMLKNPELHLDQIMAIPYEQDGREAHAITLAHLNQNILDIQDPGYQNLEQRFDPFKFQPAFNTMTMMKLMLMSAAGIEQLRQDLNCSGDICSMPGANAMLGFLKSLDGDNGWRRAENIDWQPGPGEPQMMFADCEAYSKIFMNQIGETELCPEQLIVPVISPASGTFAQPVQVTMTHPEPGAQIFYTISEVDAPVEPSNDPAHTRSHLYSQPFTMVAPFVGGVRPLVVRARAFKDGFLASETASTSITIDASLPTPSIFPNGGDFTGFVNVTMTTPTGATIYYTTNGQTPDYNSTQYTGQIQLGIGVHELRAVAYRIGFAESPVVSATFNVYDSRTDRTADVEFSPRGSGQFTTSLLVGMLSRTEDAQVRYTIAQDQVPADPTENSTLFTQPFTLGLGNWFIRAKAFKAGLPPSNLNQINYNISAPIGTVDTPVITPNGGTFNNDVEITLSATTTPPTAGVQIFYTTDGTTVAVDPQLPGNYSQPFDLRRSSTVRVRARRQFFEWSGETSANFNLVCADPEILPDSGMFLDSVEVEIQSQTQNAQIRYTTDGSEPNENSTQYGGPFFLKNSVTIKAKAFKNGYSFSQANTANFAVQNSFAPVVTRDPLSREVIVGGNILFRVEYSGVPAPQLQWQRNGIDIAGANKDTLALATVTLQNAGDYRAILSNAVGADTSKTAMLIVLPTPVTPAIAQQPQSLTVNEGDSAAFTVFSTGVPEPSYLWFRNGTPLYAQTGASLEFSNVQLSHAAGYQVQVTNSAGVVLSQPVTLTVNLITGVSSDNADIPARFELSQNYPNPFNPTTTIAFAVPRHSKVTLKLYDIRGRQLAILVDQHLAPGTYKKVFNATGLASGTYFYRMSGDGFAQTRKLLFLK
jgi:hypothetical protein